MKYLLLDIILFCFSPWAYGQGVVSGKVFDEENNLLIAASVSLFQQKDSNVVQTVLSDYDGIYRFEHIPKGMYYVVAATMGRSSSKQRIIMWNNSHVNINLVINGSVQLEEVVVRSTGVMVQGDTTKYMVNRFTSGSERNLKDVLNRLPNVRVDEETHSVTANGKRVNRILLEGQDLFQGNTAIPLENLSAEDVKNVEVIENYSEYNIYDGFKTTNETVLNVDVDKSKNRLGGEVEGYGGVQDKYDARNSSLYIGKKSMWSGIVASNNIGKHLLTFRDIMQFSGGLSNLLSGDNTADNLMKKMNMYSAFTTDREDMEQSLNSMASLNFTSYPIRPLKLTIGGIYGYDHYHSYRENSYDYFSELNYTEEAREKSHQNNGLINIKMAYMPSDDFNAVYMGHMMLAAQDKRDENQLLSQKGFTFLSSPNTLNLSNNLLLVKRMGKNLLNLSVDYSVNHYREDTEFESEDVYYSPSFHLDRLYTYDYRNRNDIYAVQLFYLHRLSDSYFLRLSLKGEEDRQSFTANGAQTEWNAIYENGSWIHYTSSYGEAVLGKDKDKLTFSLRLRYVMRHASTNLPRSFVEMNDGRLDPMWQMKYQFNPFHVLTVDYEHDTKKNGIDDLIDGVWINSYNSMISSEVERLYVPTYKVSMTHLLYLPYVGLNFINMASYERKNHPVSNDYSQEGYVNRITKRLGSLEEMFMLMSTAEYKFLRFPLNVRYSANYTHSYIPTYYGASLFGARCDNLLFMLQLVTFYKQGFNGNLKWQTSNIAYRKVPASNRLITNDLTGQLTWQNTKMYAGVDVRLNTYNLNHMHTQNIYYGFELRYDLSEQVMLRINGSDVMHLHTRRQMTGKTSSFYAMSSLTGFMPGYIMAGLSLKY